LQNVTKQNLIGVAKEQTKYKKAINVGIIRTSNRDKKRLTTTKRQLLLLDKSIISFSLQREKQMSFYRRIGFQFAYGVRVLV